MIVGFHKLFRPKFPETFPYWKIINERSLSEVVPLIIEEINEDMRSHNRHEVPGLRKALCLIATVATIDIEEIS